jgi:hypothetical protein
LWANFAEPGYRRLEKSTVLIVGRKAGPCIFILAAHDIAAREDKRHEVATEDSIR